VTALMDAPLPETEEAECIIGWRLKCLLETGYGIVAATVLASRFQGPDAIDLHQAVELVESGCPPETAVRILL